MDLRVYVDGVARIICDLTRTTTVHDIIIALAQYKGKAGRYSLIQRAPDGTQKTLSPHQLTSELIDHTDWTYILQQLPVGQKRSKSLDGRKSTINEKSLPITSSTEQIRTVQTSQAFLTLSKKKHSNHHHQTFSSINTNNSNNNNIIIHATDSPVSQKRTPISRPRSALPTENSAFQIVHNPHQQQYITLVQLLKNQEIQVEQQENDLTEKQKEINYRETILHQAQLYQGTIQHELEILEEHDRRLYAECQTFAQDYSPEILNHQLEYQEELQVNYEHLQQQLTRCSTTLEQKKQLQEQLQGNIEQIQEEIQQMQCNINQDKQEILQCEYELERASSSLKRQEDFGYVLSHRHEEIERFIQQHQKQILEMEIELIKFDNLLLNNFVHSSYHFHPTTSSSSSSSSAEVFTPVHLQFMNSTLLKLCPSGIWV